MWTGDANGNRWEAALAAHTSTHTHTHTHQYNNMQQGQHKDDVYATVIRWKWQAREKTTQRIGEKWVGKKIGREEKSRWIWHENENLPRAASGCFCVCVCVCTLMLLLRLPYPCTHTHTHTQQIKWNTKTQTRQKGGGAGKAGRNWVPPMQFAVIAPKHSTKKKGTPPLAEAFISSGWKCESLCFFFSPQPASIAKKFPTGRSWSAKSPASATP